jgi:hypothetical protein
MDPNERWRRPAAPTRPAHPATVAQPKAPHPATVAQPKAPHPATVVQPKPPHPATVVQRMPVHRATVAQPKPPHPATVVQRIPTHPALLGASAPPRPPHPATVGRPASSGAVILRAKGSKLLHKRPPSQSVEELIGEAEDEGVEVVAHVPKKPKLTLDDALEKLEDEDTSKEELKGARAAILANIPSTGEDFGKLLRRILGIIYGFASKANQAKFPAKTHDEEVSSRYGAEFREIVPRRVFDNQVLRHLRWISTSLYRMLKKKDEVQALWDGDTLFIAENSDGNTDALKKILSDRETFETKLKGLAGKKNVRWERHPKELAAALADAGLHGPIAALRAHLAQADAMEDEKKAPTSHVKFVKVEGTDKMHAEVKLVSEYLKAGSRDKTVHVAGVKRPCFACFVRLKDLATKLKDQKNVVLVSNPHKGLLWPSKAAWEGATLEAKRIALEELGLDEYIEYRNDDDAEGLRAHIAAHHFYLTKDDAKAHGAYDRDTSSEEEEEEEEEEGEEEES